MSSQGSSSVRAISKTAFAPMSGDLLTSCLGRSLRPALHQLSLRLRSPLVQWTGGYRARAKAASTSGCQSKGEVEEIAVSCGDLQSSLMPEDCTQIAQEYGLEVAEPDDMKRPYTPLDGYVTLFECDL